MKRLFFLILILLTAAAPAFADEIASPKPDFESLQMLYPQIRAWIQNDTLGISQIVPQSDNNTTLRTHTYADHTGLNRQSIFLDCRNELNDDVLWLYGSAKNNGYLRPLILALEADEPEARSTWELVLPDKHLKLTLCTVSDQIRLPLDEITRHFESQEEYTAFCENELAACATFGGSFPETRSKLVAICAFRTAPYGRILWYSAEEFVPQKTYDPSKVLLDSIEGFSGPVQVGNLGVYYNYAQNDPIWERMRYESAPVSNVFRVFSGGGCGPTAAAIIVANLIPKEKLTLIEESLTAPVTICQCSVNRLFCNETHIPYLISSPDEYLRYLPTVIANFCAGNNIWDFNGRRDGGVGTYIELFDYVCRAYDLKETIISNMDEALSLLSDPDRHGLVLSYAQRSSPFSNGSHYVVIVGADEEYFYVLDPWKRDDYKKTDQKRIAEIIGTGVARIKLTDTARSELMPHFFIEVKSEKSE